MVLNWICSSLLRGFLFSRVPWIKQTLLPLRRSPVPTRFFSSSRRRTTKAVTVAAAESPMDAGEPFYVVRKGNVIGIYKTLSECQAQVSNSVCDPSVTVFKGYSLRKETEEYLAARGLRNAVYAIDAADARDDLFGNLVPCPFQQPDGASSSALKRPQETLSCILEFDGASKGNPGKAGAGAIIRSVDGSVVAQLREGLGVATNNAAEYRALILGLKYAAKKGFKYIRAQGDSKLVCNQVQDLWRARNDNMADLYKKVKELKGMFLSFQISHVLRYTFSSTFDTKAGVQLLRGKNGHGTEFNSAADAQANFAVELPVGEVQEQSNFTC